MERPDNGTVDDAVPEADRLEQSRPEVQPELDPEAPADTEAVTGIGETDEANEADVLEQSLEVPEGDEPRGE